MSPFRRCARARMKMMLKIWVPQEVFSRFARFSCVEADLPPSRFMHCLFALPLHSSRTRTSPTELLPAPSSIYNNCIYHGTLVSWLPTYHQFALYRIQHFRIDYCNKLTPYSGKKQTPQSSPSSHTSKSQDKISLLPE